MKKRAFTLVETLVAISILLIALVGPLTISATGLSSAFYARDQVTAFYLAQEGVEYIRFVRDFNSNDTAIDRTEWMNSLGPCLAPNYCQINTPDSNFLSAIQACNAAEAVELGYECKPLYLDSTTNLYGYPAGGGTPTQFTRKIQVTPIDDNGSGLGTPEDMKITVTVYWRSPLPNHSFTMTSYLSNWKR